MKEPSRAQDAMFAANDVSDCSAVESIVAKCGLLEEKPLPEGSF
jgi:hypothetical protein